MSRWPLRRARVREAPLAKLAVRATLSSRMTQISDRTILFADLRGSTGLFETLGNAEATSVVTHCVSRARARRWQSTAATSSRRSATA